MNTAGPSFTDLIERARGVPIEAEIARRGIRLTGRIDRCGACPRCGGCDRFSINVRKQVFLCRGAAAGDVIAMVRHLDGCSFVTAVEVLADGLSREGPQYVARQQRSRDPDHDAARISSALRWWREAGPIAGTAGIAYLERDRGIFDLPPDVHDVLRFHGRCVWGQDGDGRWIFRPCILALLRDVITDHPTGVHRIALDAAGKLIGRKALGRKKNAAIKLWPDVEAGLVVGEGLETVLAAAIRVQHRGTLLQPAWSLVDAGNLETLPVIAGIEHLTILADADDGNRG